jgi:hypothetical protein
MWISSKEYYNSRTESEWPGGEVYEEYNKDGANKAGDKN